MSYHHDQAVSVLKRALQEILSRGLQDPRIRGLLSVTDVELSPDLADATVSVSVIPEAHAELALHGLQHAAAHVRSALTEKVKLRRVPSLRFTLDDSLKREAETLAAINRARARDERDLRGREGSFETEESDR